MHLILMLGQKNKEEFALTYSGFSNLLCGLKQFLANVTLIFGLALTMIYKQKSEEKMRNMDPLRLEYRQQYTIGIVTSILVFIAWIGLNFMPKYTNTFYFLAEFSDADYSAFKSLAYVTDAFFIISWIIASSYNTAASSQDLEPDDDGDEGEHVHMGSGTDGKEVDCDSDSDSHEN